MFCTRKVAPAVFLVTLAACSTTGQSTTEGTSSTGTQTDTVETGETEFTTEDPGPESPDYTQPGPYPVGNTRFTVEDADRGRMLEVEVWYPADMSAADDAALGQPIDAFVKPGADHDQFVGLLATAHDPGTRRQSSAALDAPGAEGPWPVVLFSHCHSCTRFSSYSVAEYLASHGFAVVAPDHQGNTLFDELAGMNAPLNGEFLITRREDLGFTLDTVLDANHSDVPESVRGMFDADRVGAIGHSYGAATVGLLAQEDTRVQAIFPIAAPIENPLLPGPTMAEIQVPVFFILAREDNSITELGNNVLRTNFNSANPPAWLVEVNDAGHWSFSDICGLVEMFDPGCGEGMRQTNGEAFTYLDIAVARNLAGAYATAFFDLHLRDVDTAGAFLDASYPDGVAEVMVRP